MSLPSRSQSSVRFVSVSHPTDPNPVNSLGAETRAHLARQLRDAASDPSVSSIVLIGNGPNFSAGADIKEFSSVADVASSTEDAPSLTDLCDTIERSRKPVVAALRGVALGGGCELALSCHYRIADEDPRAGGGGRGGGWRGRCAIGLPECKIGLIPGAGGTQRLPRLCGVEFALRVIVGGETVGAEEALEMDLIDGIVGSGEIKMNETLEECAVRWARYAEVAAPLCLDYCRTSLRAVPDDPADAARICDEVAARLPPRERGGEAVRAAVEAVRASFAPNTGFAAGMAREEELFLDLLTRSAQGRALRHAFFAERAVGKPRDPPNGAGASAIGRKGKPSEAALALLKFPDKASVGIIGAGTMGSGISVSFLRGGYPVVLVDNNAEGLKRGLAAIKKIVTSDVKRGKLSPSNAEKLVANLRGTTGLNDLAGCALIVEAVFENLEVKKSVFSKLDGIARPDALLLTNTSTLDVNSIASALSSPGRRRLSAGMHFFSPAHVMKLVEIVTSGSTAPQTLEVIRGVTKRIGKVGVTVGNCDGFVGNRMLFPYTSEMVFVVQGGGASVSEVDAALVGFGMSMGPFAMSDLAGNDIGYNIRREKGLVEDPETRARGRKRGDRMRYTTLPDELVTKLGRVGQKAGKGWYDYDPKVGRGRKPLPSAEVSSFVAAHAGTTPGEKLAPDEIVRRLLYPLVNEGFKILEEGMASHPDDVDVIYLYGYGFPAWRGGPMHWADDGIKGGLPRLLETLEDYHRKHPGSEYFRPSGLLRECVGVGLRVREYYERGHQHAKGKEGLKSNL